MFNRRVYRIAMLLSVLARQEKKLGSVEDNMYLLWLIRAYLLLSGYVVRPTYEYIVMTIINGIICLHQNHTFDMFFRKEVPGTYLHSIGEKDLYS